MAHEAGLVVPATRFFGRMSTSADRADMNLLCWGRSPPDRPHQPVFPLVLSGSSLSHIQQPWGHVLLSPAAGQLSRPPPDRDGLVEVGASSIPTTLHGKPPTLHTDAPGTRRRAIRSLRQPAGSGREDDLVGALFSSRPDRSTSARRSTFSRQMAGLPSASMFPNFLPPARGWGRVNTARPSAGN